MAKMQVDKALIRELANLLNETNLTEIEVEEADRRIRVARTVTVNAVAPSAPAAAPAAPAPTAIPAVEAPVEDASHPGAVLSPMVGTVYTSAEPGAAPFVEVGSRIEAGQTILIVEAMKVMNPILAPRGGTVKKILVANAQPVEYGEVLLVIE